MLDGNVENPNENFPAAKRFRKLADAAGLVVVRKATRCLIPETHYASKSANHNVGDVKSPAVEREFLALTAMSPDRSFVAWAFWEEGTLQIAKWGGKVYPPGGPRVFYSKKITELYEALKGVAGIWEAE